jgi:hypothetical protein
MSGVTDSYGVTMLPTQIRTSTLVEKFQQKYEKVKSAMNSNELRVCDEQLQVTLFV